MRAAVVVWFGLVACSIPLPVQPQSVASAALELHGDVTADDNTDSTLFTIADSRARVEVRIVNDLALRWNTIARGWTNTFVQARQHTLSVFAPEVGFGPAADPRLDMDEAAMCFARPRERTKTASAYALLCTALDVSRRPLDQTGRVIYEVEVFLPGIPQDSDVDRFFRLALSPGRIDKPLLAAFQKVPAERRLH